jgi:hypothetical protein
MCSLTPPPPQKLEAIRGWLAHQQALGSGVRPGRCLVLTGPAGAGKSTAARFVAHDAGFDVTEWNAPMPTLWDERGGGGGAQDNGGGGTYQSKVRSNCACCAFWNPWYLYRRCAALLAHTRWTLLSRG